MLWVRRFWATNQGIDDRSMFLASNGHYIMQRALQGFVVQNEEVSPKAACDKWGEGGNTNMSVEYGLPIEHFWYDAQLIPKPIEL